MNRNEAPPFQKPNRIENSDSWRSKEYSLPKRASYTPDNIYNIPLDTSILDSSENIGPYIDSNGAMVTYFDIKGENGKILNVAIREFGLDKPLAPGEPIPLRIDHGCLCMTEPLQGHDCKEQREITLEAMKTVGRGIMIEVDTSGNEGMGYGRVTVARNTAFNQQRVARGEIPLTIHEYFKQEGISEFDIRQHPTVAELFSKKLDQLSQRGIITEDNPLVLLGSSLRKIDSIINGHRIPVPYYAPVLTGNHDKSKENNGYNMPSDVEKKGVFLQYTDTQGQERYVNFVDIFPDFSAALQKQAQLRTTESTVVQKDFAQEDKKEVTEPTLRRNIL